VTRTALPHVYSGKVRELYEVGHDRLLIVASDRVSVYDVVLPDDIPDKGRVLTALSSFWFEQTASIVANHAISCDPTDFPETAGDVAGRAMLVRATQPVRLECVVRGYLFGNAWREYRDRGTINGVGAPAGLREAQQLPEPLFTPTTKADSGHDEALWSVVIDTTTYAMFRCVSTNSARRTLGHTGSSSPTRSSSSARSTAKSF
jgi:phosphoribosylaminoimidazole-succinocarboxamide synthase